MIPQTFLEQIPIDRLSRSGAVARSNDHLAICGRHTTRGVKARNGSFHTVIDDNLPLVVEVGTETLAETIVEHIAARGEKRVN
ncbi:MAG: hypothetical protein ABIQ35_00305, partial [Verrucomicrobiota bacterium]